MAGSSDSLPRTRTTRSGKPAECCRAMDHSRFHGAPLGSVRVTIDTSNRPAGTTRSVEAEQRATEADLHPARLPTKHSGLDRQVEPGAVSMSSVWTNGLAGTGRAAEETRFRLVGLTSSLGIRHHAQPPPLDFDGATGSGDAPPPCGRGSVGHRHRETRFSWLGWHTSRSGSCRARLRCKGRRLWVTSGDCGAFAAAVRLRNLARMDSPVNRAGVGVLNQSINPGMRNRSG